MTPDINQNLFTNDEMQKMDSPKLVPKLNKTAVFFYESEGVNMNKCGTCTHWLNLRTLFHFTDGLMTACVPCIKDEEKKKI